jgi:hypothetical protein
MEEVVLLYASNRRLEGWVSLDVGGALEMEVSLDTGGCSNVGITYTRVRQELLSSWPVT